MRIDSDLKTASAEWHNQTANRIIAQILDEPIAAGGSLSDVAILLESVLVGVLGSAFRPGVSIHALGAIVYRTTDRLAKLETNAETKSERNGESVKRSIN